MITKEQKKGIFKFIRFWNEGESFCFKTEIYFKNLLIAEQKIKEKIDGKNILVTLKGNKTRKGIFLNVIGGGITDFLIIKQNLQKLSIPTTKIKNIEVLK